MLDALSMQCARLAQNPFVGEVPTSPTASNMQEIGKNCVSCSVFVAIFAVSWYPIV